MQNSTTNTSFKDVKADKNLVDQPILAKKETAKLQGSLRNRLLLMLMLPLILISSIFAVESYQNAYNISKSSFDKALSILSLTLIEQNDNIFGNTLSEEILTVVSDAFGDIFYYHAIAPNSSVITGYSNPPKPSELPNSSLGKPFLFDSQYHGNPVRAAFVKRYSDNPDFPGWVELTVWQTFDQQIALQRSIFIRSIARMLSLILLVACTCWFGIRYGLQPLDKLQTAIARRSLSDLEPIKRAVPMEVKSLVSSMNDLFFRLRSAIQKREAFLANASHQLKTPLANMQGKAELALRATDESSRTHHIRDLIAISKQSSRLTSQMLSLLRAESEDILINPIEEFELNRIIRDVCIHYAPTALRQGREIHFKNADNPIIMNGHPLMITECVSNLIENAMAYSHEQKNIEVELTSLDAKTPDDQPQALIKVCDAGPGIPEHLQTKATSRFYRLPSTDKDGCGLGLAIVQEIAKNHHGKVFFEGPSAIQFVIGITIPIPA